ncbi:MAG: acyltransferase family protein [Candidatus Thermoplasmatota archaeon]|nr:acyltransferase family protein [Candidatus Thermoplasmatota archaeon]
MSRRKDIDQIRGLAILLMIMVHAAATWAPADASTTSLLALVVAGLGGLAAPLFVTVGGWVTVQSTWTIRKALIRFVFLMVAQFLVNITASHLFDPFTPGVLSLFAILYLLAPLWVRIAGNSVAFGTTLALIGIINSVLSPGDASLSWDDRIGTSGIDQILSHMLVTGTYPLFPWIFFSILGAGINIHTPSIRRLGLVSISGMLLCTMFLYESVQTGTPFAQPRGEAILTFFPANTPFLIGACTGVLIIWLLLENRQPFRGLHHLGQLSLTLYLVHFIPIYMGSNVILAWSSAVPVVIVFTIVWWPLSVFWRTRFPTYSLEYALRQMSRHEEERAP